MSLELNFCCFWNAFIWKNYNLTFTFQMEEGTCILELFVVSNVLWSDKMKKNLVLKQNPCFISFSIKLSKCVLFSYFQFKLNLNGAIFRRVLLCWLYRRFLEKLRRSQTSVSTLRTASGQTSTETRPGSCKSPRTSFETWKIVLFFDNYMLGI